MIQLPSGNRYSFNCDGKPLVRRLLFITGINRSGTTFIGNLVGSLKNMEYDFEPWIFHCLPMMVASGHVKEDAAIEMLRGYFNETLTSSILGRNANLRPADDSRIWMRLSLDELISRWSHIKTRWDVQNYVHSNGSTLSIKAINFTPFLGLLWKVNPQAKVLCIQRHPLAVIASVKKKGWMNLENLQKLEGLPIRKSVFRNGKNWYLPWWLKDEDIDTFFEASEYRRAFLQWKTLQDLARDEKERLGIAAGKENLYLEVKYEDLLRDPKNFMQIVASFAESSMTSETENLLKKVCAEYSIPFELGNELTESERIVIADYLKANRYEETAQVL